MFTGLSATPYRRGSAIVGRIFFPDGERTVVWSEPAQQGYGGMRGERSEKGVIFP